MPPNVLFELPLLVAALTSFCLAAVVLRRRQAPVLRHCAPDAGLVYLHLAVHRPEPLDRGDSLLLIGTLWMLWVAAHSAGLLRRQALALLAGIAPVWLANALYLLDWGPAAWLDLTPFAMTISGAIYAWSLLRLRLLDIVPVARSKIFGFIADAIVVVDQDNRIADANAAAQQLALQPDQPLIGKPLAALLGDQAGRVQPQAAGRSDGVGDGVGDGPDDGVGDVQVKFTAAAPAGSYYVLSVKYDTKAVVGTNLGAARPTVKYTFTTDVGANGSVEETGIKGITLAPK